MKIWTNEHVFSHRWDTICKGQWQKYPNPHNPAVLATDVLDRSIDKNGVLHSKRIISSDWGLAPWVQSLIGANRTCFAYEYSTVDPAKKVMSMRTINLTFCNFVAMEEQVTYTPHPEKADRTVMKHETVVSVQGVPLTSYMESLILNTVSSNAAKGHTAMNWIISKIKAEKNSVGHFLDNLKVDISNLKSFVEEKVLHTAHRSIEELQRDLRCLQPPILAAEEQNKKL